MNKLHGCKWIAHCVAVAVVQYLAVRLGLLMGIAHGNVSPVWPATGVAIALLLRFGLHLWPGLAFGSFLGLAQTGVGIPVAMGEAVAAGLEAVTAYYLVRRWIESEDPFSRTRDVICFCVLAGCMAPAISATVGVASLWLGGLVAWTSLAYLWGTWWLGDVMGSLIVAPFLIVWTAPGALRLDPAIWKRIVPVLALLILAGIIAFWGPFVSSTGVGDYPIAFLTLPFVVFTTFVADIRGATVACVLCTAMATTGTAHGFGPFFRGSVNESLLLLQSYLVVVSVTAIILAAVLNERNHALESLRLSQEDLAIRIEQRTGELLTANKMLNREMAERTHAEESLRESEQRYRNFFTTSRDCVFMTTPEGRLSDFNDITLDVLGYSYPQRKEIMGRAVSDFYANPEERKGIVAMILEKGFCKEIPLDLRKQDGTIIQTLITIVARRDKIGNLVGFQGTVRDITDQKKAERLLRNTVQRFHSILSSLYAGLLIVAEDGTVEFVNQAFCDMFDLPDLPESLEGLAAPDMIQKVLIVYADPADALERITEAVARHRPIRGDEITTRDGRTYTVDFIPLFVEGKRCGRLWHHTDITYRKRAEEEKAQLVANLTDALAQVKKLSGFLPICASCKKIRDDQGYWRQVEEYIREHSEAEFSHSICPECSKKLYPDFFDDDAKG